ncbi:MAG: amidase [Anaerolineales bacterium]
MRPELRTRASPEAPSPAKLPSLLERSAISKQGGTQPAAMLDILERDFNALEPSIQAFLPEVDRFGRVRREARAQETDPPEASKRGPLFGVPIGVKDVFHVRGFPTTAGSRVPLEEISGEQGDAVSRLTAAGALILGKTVTTEFAYFAPGPTRNPRNLNHTPGGSSSGSAAAVATRLAPLALGTQTIGSIIRPAAFCGIVGFKPSQGRIPITGLVPLAPTLDQVGYFTIDVVDAELVAPLLVSDWVPSGLDRPPVLGIPVGSYLDAADLAARSQFRSTLALLLQHNYSLIEVPFPGDFDTLRARHQTILAAEAAAVHSHWFAKYADRYHSRTADLIVEGRTIETSDLDKARRERLEWTSRMTDDMARSGIDLWVSPSAPGTAPEGLAFTGDPVMNVPWTHAGTPTLTLPSGEDSRHLPYGLQLVGRPGSDEALLAWAVGIEQALAVAG